MLGRSRGLLLIVAAGMIAAAGLIAASPTADVRGEDAIAYVGARKCRTCHKEQHEAWQSMKHAKAWEVLKPEDIATGKDPEGRPCIQCHTTGYGKPNGFVSAEKTPALKGIGCEVCHGPGKKHVKVMTLFMMESEDEDDEKVEEMHISRSVDACTTCHNPHISYKKLYGDR